MAAPRAEAVRWLLFAAPLTNTKLEYYLRITYHERKVRCRIFVNIRSLSRVLVLLLLAARSLATTASGTDAVNPNQTAEAQVKVSYPVTADGYPIFERFARPWARTLQRSGPPGLPRACRDWSTIPAPTSTCFTPRTSRSAARSCSATN